MQAAAPTNPRYGAASHAHPLPATPPPCAVEEQRIRAMIARQPVAVKLHGLSRNRAPTVTDVLLPKTRRSPFDADDKNPIHLDLTETWKGLSQSQATELTMWYHFLHVCLQEEVRTSLCESVVSTILQSGEPIDELHFLSRMLDSLWEREFCVLGISFVDLIDNMMGMFHDRFPMEAAPVASNWSQFSGGLSRFLYNLLRTQDCFRESRNGPCLEVVFDFQCAQSTVTAIGNVLWQVPKVRFFNILSSLPTGWEYQIKPYTPREDIATLYPGQDLHHYAEETTYTISRSSLSFIWDPRRKSFVSVLPADGSKDIVETVVSACVTTLFPHNIKFERQSRWSITLDTRSARSHSESRQSLVDMNAEHVGDDDADLDPAARYAFCTAVDEENQKASLEDDASRGIPLSLSQKRKMSKPEVIAGYCCSKRPRHSPQLTLNTQLGGDMTLESLWPHSFDRPNKVDADSGYTSDEWFGAEQPERYPLRASLANTRKQTFQRDRNPWSPATLSQDTRKSAPNFFAETTSCLRQQQIIRNYKEFADRKLYKTSSLIDSPVSEGEFRAYEQIFLDDSEVCSPVTDESTVDFDAVMEEV